jgi:leader peptidase (prepilin peptidase) / N-methyltransferase
LVHLVYILFAFALGASIGSFLNVVVYRLPRGESLVTTPSHCPRCNKSLRWYDNVPVIGWIHLRGRCRFCKKKISIRYPIVEAFCGGMFAFYYLMFFVFNIGPVPDAGNDGPLQPVHFLSFFDDWPIYALYMYLLSALLAASLIDAELFEIPIDILWSWKGGIVWIGLVAHVIMDHRGLPGNLLAGATLGALGAGGSSGLLISFTLLHWGILPRSFSEGMPMLEIERDKMARDEAARIAADPQAKPGPAEEIFTPQRIRDEMRKEMLFLLPPLGLAFIWLLLTIRVPGLSAAWSVLIENHYIASALGAAYGGLVGGLVVWVTRIVATYVFGREAMGLGDVHLMVGVGAVMGAGAATVAFFLAPFFAMAVAVYMLLTGTRRELPFGPYLSMATGFVMLFYPPIALYLAQGITGLGWVVGQWLGVRPGGIG